MDPSPTTFAVANNKPNRGYYNKSKLVIPEKVKYDPAEDGKLLESLQNHFSPFKKNNCTEVLMGSNFPPKSRLGGFIGTVLNCYNNHHNLIIRPDDIWMAIMTQFSYYVNAHAEKFRGKFVKFEGKKTVDVGIPGSLRSAPYDLFVKLMSKKIDENLVDPEVKGWILPNFSTTTDNDLVSCGVVFMATMKKYFEYKCMLFCGIPFITLEGSVNDWENILKRIDKLREYELYKWHDMLKPILEQFVDAKKGKVDETFWGQICDYRPMASGPTYLSGWITAFCMFDVEGREISRHIAPNPSAWSPPKEIDSDTNEFFFVGLDSTHSTNPNSSDRWPQIEIENVPTGIVEVNVKIVEGEIEHDSVMFAGHMAHEIEKDEVSLRSTIGWAICLKDKNAGDGKEK